METTLPDREPIDSNVLMNMTTSSEGTKSDSKLALEAAVDEARTAIDLARDWFVSSVCTTSLAISALLTDAKVA
jgi:hypothetical protein